MATCKNCGFQIPDGANVCPNCGAAAPVGNQPNGQQTIDKAMNTPDYTSQYNLADIEANKGLCVLSYLGILLLIPLLAKNNSPYVKFHSNQGLLLFITSIVLSVISAIPILGWIIGTIGGLIVFIFAIMGIINTINGTAKELPIIGKYRLLK